ncbi:CLUMA_CG019438, isoform A [Clunio marinus]|uniref:CLUMA_CG019438, isoform A n=1 Tax=Clunio marinus TaxID=568069 RepID=A0A1J1J2V2_9DIPT|nr:CLUMA_CG019438, isoform A [Clunio marinus]
MEWWLILIIVLSVFLGIALLLLLLRWYMRGSNYTKDTKIDNKVVIITGANTGIGKENAIDFAKRGGKVYIACRDLKRGEDALGEIRRISGSNNVHFLQLDLASMDSIREFSRKFHELESQLHILINNAGVMACDKAYTKDGFEMQLGTNHLGHFLLTHLLLDLLKASAPSRIVAVSSEGHRMGNINKTDLMSEKSYSKWGAYGQSKLANILFARELGKKLEGTGVVVNSLHPGVVKTELGRHMSANFQRFFMKPFSFLYKTPWEGAQTQICVALDPDLENVTGKYFSDCKEKTPSSNARNDETAKWLYDKSIELVKL